jgi:hypothetical protein
MSRSRHPTRLIRHALWLAAWVCAGTRPAGAQEAVSTTSGSPAAIAHIRAEFAEIERGLPGYRRTTHELSNFSLEGGELQAFYDGRELRKLHVRHFGETGRVTEEFYFSNGRPIFIYTVHERYDQPLSGRVQARVEHRFYFDGDRLIRRVRTQSPALAEDLSQYDPELPTLLRNAELFAACAAATGANPPECSAPER